VDNRSTLSCTAHGLHYTLVEQVAL